MLVGYCVSDMQVKVPAKGFPALQDCYQAML